MTKRKKTGRRRIKRSGRSRPSVRSRKAPSALSARRRAIWVLAVAVFICAGTAGFFSLRFLWRTDEELQTTQQPPGHTEEQVLLPVHKPLRTGQEVLALKEEELELAEKLMRDFPGSEDSLALMGNVQHRHGDAVEAVKFWQKALAINPNRADVYESMGWLSIKKGEFEKAIALYRKALERQPKLPNAHSNIGHALMILGRQDEAMEELEKEIQISPNSSFAYFLLGQAYLQRSEYEKAKQYYETVIKLDPQYANAYYGLATICTHLGDSEKAKVYAEQFRKLKAEQRKDLKGRKLVYDDFVETQKGAALTYIAAGRMYQYDGNGQEAEELLKRAAGLDPENAECFLQLASLYQEQGQLSNALTMHRKISEIQPGNPMCYVNIGMFSVQLNQFDEAEEAFRKVITLTPQRSNGYRYLARLYLSTNSKLAEARRLAEKAVTLEAIAVNYFLLSSACYKNGDMANALSAIKRAVELEPGNSEYRRLYELIQLRN